MDSSSSGYTNMAERPGTGVLPLSAAPAGTLDTGRLARDEHRQGGTCHSTVGTVHGGDLPRVDELDVFMDSSGSAPAPTTLAGTLAAAVAQRNPTGPPIRMGPTRVIHTGGCQGQIWLQEGQLAYARWNGSWYYKYADSNPTDWTLVPLSWWESC